MEEFLKKHYGAQSVADIDVYAGLYHPPWEQHAYENTVRCTLEAHGMVTAHMDTVVGTLANARFAGGPSSIYPRGIRDDPEQQRHINLDAVYPYRARVTEIDRFDTPNDEDDEDEVHFHGRFLYSVDDDDPTALLTDRVLEHMGGLPRATLDAPPGVQAKQVTCDLIEQPHPFRIHTHPYFIKTMAMLTEENVENGIVLVPPRVAADTPSLPANIEGTDGLGHHIDAYYLVPHDHVLAWPIRNVTDEHRGRMGYTVVREIRAIGRGIVFYIVDGESYRLLLSSCKAHMLGRLTPKMLGHDVGIEWANCAAPPMTPLMCAVAVRMEVSYVCFRAPSPEQVARIAPVLHPDFIGYKMFHNMQVIKRESRMDMAKKREETPQTKRR